MDPFTWIITNILGLLAGGAGLFIPVLACALLLTFLFNFVQKKTGWKWIGAATLTIAASFIAFFLILHLSFLLGGLSNTDISQIPPDIRDDPLYAQTVVSPIELGIRIIPQSILTGIIFSLLTLPFALFGVFLFDSLRKKIKGFWLRFAITTYAGCVLFILLIVFFPWLPVSLLYLAFFGF
ncbi:MAG: hypothetical protein AABW68_03150 [archaeon]